MKGTGCWDNAVNRMMTKFYGNVKVHAMKGLAESAANFVSSACLWRLIFSHGPLPRAAVRRGEDQAPLPVPIASCDVASGTATRAHDTLSHTTRSASGAMVPNPDRHGAQDAI